MMSTARFGQNSSTESGPPGGLEELNPSLGAFVDRRIGREGLIRGSVEPLGVHPAPSRFSQCVLLRAQFRYPAIYLTTSSFCFHVGEFARTMYVPCTQLILRAGSLVVRKLVPPFVPCCHGSSSGLPCFLIDISHDCAPDRQGLGKVA